MKQEKKLEEAKRLYKDANADQRYVLESLFPELAEIEDVRIRKEIIAYIKTGTYHKDWVSWLEKQGLQKLAWGEEDETRLTNIIIMLKEGASLHFSKNDITKAVDWLKSLKPQNRWKPSDEQMNNLKQAISAFPYETDYLELLYEDLKKLREE